MHQPITVAYCTNSAMAFPMCVSVNALLKHINKNQHVIIHLIQEGWTIKDTTRLKHIINSSEGSCDLVIHDVDLSIFSKYPSLHGNYTAYARLLLPKLIDANRILYLDSDTLPLIDVSSFFQTDLEKHVMGAVSWNVVVATANDREVLLSEGLSQDEPYFNSGVLLIDAEQFRSENFFKKCIETADRLGDKLLVCDQTLINIVFNKRIKPLPWKLNVRLGYQTKKYDKNGLIHFVGYFKPWDFLGYWLHGNGKLWQNWVKNLEANINIRNNPGKKPFKIKLFPLYIKAIKNRLIKSNMASNI